MKCCAFEKVADPKKKAILDKINGMGFALFIIMIGTLFLMPKGTLPETTWLIGSGIIMLGGNVARRLNGITLCQCTIALGGLLLIAGILGIYGIELPLLPILLVLAGIGIVAGLVSKKKCCKKE